MEERSVIAAYRIIYREPVHELPVGSKTVVRGIELAKGLQVDVCINDFHACSPSTDEEGFLRR